MKAVVHLHSGEAISGTLIDSIEYWMFINDLGVPVYYLTNLEKPLIQRIIESRYVDFRPSLLSLIGDITSNYPSKILMFGRTFMKISHTLSGVNFRCIHSYASAAANVDHPNFFTNYQKKMYLSKLKCTNVRRQTYVHLKKALALSERTIQHLRATTEPTVVYAAPSDKSTGDRLCCENQNVKFVFGGVIPNFFEQFDEMMYIYEGPDHSPRLFIECAYLGKRISYLGLDECRENGIIPDASAIRFRDAQLCNIQKYHLTSNDAAISWLLIK